MMRQPVLVSIAAVLFASAAVFPMGAQSRAAKPAASAPTVSAVQALPLTCAQAWVAAHRNYAEVLPIVTTLAKVSLVNRNLVLPNTREAGLDAGKGIAEDCKADPNALLFAIVDKHVRRVAGTTSQAK